MRPARLLAFSLVLTAAVALALPWRAAEPAGTDSHAGGPPRAPATSTERPGATSATEHPKEGPVQSDAHAAHGAGHAGGARAASSTALPSADELWGRLRDGNLRFVASAPLRRTYHERRAELAQSQHPPVMVLACADSRVGPELVFDQTLGELFVVRAAGNVADAFAIASLEYAAEHLGCRLLVVMGHERCGAVKAAASSDAMPSPSLAALVERIRPAFARVPGGEHEPAELLALQVEANVRQSAIDLLSGSEILMEKLAGGELSIVKCVYDLDTGDARRVY